MQNNDNYYSYHFNENDDKLNVWFLYWFLNSLLLY